MMADPKITPHARERCAEMGISTKVAKRIWRDPDLVLPDFQGRATRRFLHSSTVEPAYAIVVEGEDIVVTVLHYSPEERFTR